MRIKNISPLLLVIGLVLTGFSGDAVCQYWTESEAIIQVEDGVDLDSLADACNLTVLDSLPSRNIAVVRSNSYMPTEELLEELIGMPVVIYAEPHLIVEDPESQQKSEAFVDQIHPNWDEGVSPELYFGHFAREQIDLAMAHGYSTGSGAVVAVLDNGLDLSHPALIQNLASDPYIPCDYVDDDLDPSEVPGGDAYGHGTFVSSMIRMIAPDVMILPLRVLDSSGHGSLFDVVKAVYYAAELEVDAINLSLGTPVTSWTLADAVAFADSIGVCCIASVGNENSIEESYPAACDSVIAVTAVDSADVKAEFANYGGWITLSAPGVDLYGALADGEFGWWSGTSFSAALVSGTVALLRSALPDLEPQTIRELVELTADGIDDQNPGYEGQLGSGRLNCGRALLAAMSCGDADGSGGVDIDDAVYLIDFIFASGPPPEPMACCGDADASCVVDIDDVVHLTEYIYGAGAAPLPGCCACGLL